MNPDTSHTLPPGAKILLTGSTGQVGGELLKLLALLGEVVAPTRTEMDLANAASIRHTIRALRPRWIVNPAAYTAVDKAETEPELAYAINAEAVHTIAQEASTIGAAVIHFSTDYVFDGNKSTPYVETDTTNPTSVYGQSKLAGEHALTASGAPHLIFRTSWVYGATGKNFLLTILKLAKERDALRIVADQHGAPTWSRDLAHMTSHVIQHCEAGSTHADLIQTLTSLTGIYHVAAAGETTWHGFASEAIRLTKERQPETRFAAIEPIPSSEYPTPAKRPANSRMNCNKLAETFRWKMMPWHDSLQKVIDELSQPV